MFKTSKTLLAKLVRLSRKLEGEDIMVALRQLHGNKSEQREAYINLQETFDPLVFSLLNKVKHVIHGQEEYATVKQFIITTFYEVISAANTNLDLPQFLNYLKLALSGRINADTVNNELGHTSIIHDIHKIDNLFRIGVAKFVKQYRRNPDLLHSEEDVELFSKLIGKSLEDTNEMLQYFGAKVKSLYQSVGDDSGEDKEKVLIDVLESDIRLPDKLFEDKMFVKTLVNVAQKVLTPDERAVFMLYYHPDNWHGEDKTKEEISKETGIPFSRVRTLLEKSKQKLQKDQSIKELKKAFQVTDIIKLAMQIYDIRIINKKAYLVNVYRKTSDEVIIQDVMKRLS